jgi:hypothetical protein
MSRNIAGCALAGVFALAVGVAAQYPPSNPQNPPQTPPSAAQDQTPATVEGCLMREQDIPGRKPNVAERAGAAEDYILASVKVIKGSAPQGSTEQAKPGEPTGTSGKLAPMYDVKGIDDEKLKPLVGKRVQIDGTFADVAKSPTAGGTEDLVDIRGTAIRPASGECPAGK